MKKECYVHWGRKWVDVDTGVESTHWLDIEIVWAYSESHAIAKAKNVLLENGLSVNEVNALEYAVYDMQGDPVWE